MSLQEIQGSHVTLFSKYGASKNTKMLFFGKIKITRQKKRHGKTLADTDLKLNQMKLHIEGHILI